MEKDYKLAKWLNDNLSEKELQEIQQDEDFALLEKIKEHSSLLKIKNFNKTEMLETILASKKETKIIPLYQNILYKVAAVLLIGFGFLFSLYQLNNETILANNKLGITLPDNSEVTLNKNATVEYNKLFWKFNRKIELSGEAYFKVQKGEKFQVITQNGTVSVLGTQFNVKTENSKFEVSCYEGKVKVEAHNQTTILTKGMVVSLDKNHFIPSKTHFTEPLWHQSFTEFEFKNTYLKDILSKIEMHYQVKITHQFNTYQTFTGKIPRNNLPVALEIIASTYHLQILTKDSKEYELKVP